MCAMETSFHCTRFDGGGVLVGKVIFLVNAIPIVSGSGVGAFW